MAHSGMSWQQYNSHQKFTQHGPGARSILGGSDGDKQEMHLKMSKKIAQLTKVRVSFKNNNSFDNPVISRFVCTCHCLSFLMRYKIIPHHT